MRRPYRQVPALGDENEDGILPASRIGRDLDLVGVRGPHSHLLLRFLELVAVYHRRRDAVVVDGHVRPRALVDGADGAGGVTGGGGVARRTLARGSTLQGLTISSLSASRELPRGTQRSVTYYCKWHLLQWDVQLVVGSGAAAIAFTDGRCERRA